MGCVICNMLEIWSRKLYLSKNSQLFLDKTLDYEDCIKCAKVEEADEIEGLRVELVNEICNDIAIQHPEMVKRINEIVRLERQRKWELGEIYKGESEFEDSLIPLRVHESEILSYLVKIKEIVGKLNSEFERMLRLKCGMPGPFPLYTIEEGNRKHKEFIEELMKKWG